MINCLTHYSKKKKSGVWLVFYLISRPPSLETLTVCDILLDNWELCNLTHHRLLSNSFPRNDSMTRIVVYSRRSTYQQSMCVVGALWCISTIFFRHICYIPLFTFLSKIFEIIILICPRNSFSNKLLHSFGCFQWLHKYKYIEKLKKHPLRFPQASNWL